MLFFGLLSHPFQLQPPCSLARSQQPGSAPAQGVAASGEGEPREETWAAPISCSLQVPNQCALGSVGLQTLTSVSCGLLVPHRFEVVTSWPVNPPGTKGSIVFIRPSGTEDVLHSPSPSSEKEKGHCQT